MLQKISLNTCSKSTQFNRYVYVLFIGLAIYLAIKGDFNRAFINFGIAVVFYPLNRTAGSQPPRLYGKTWLVVHAAIALAGLVFLWFKKH